VIVIGIVFFGLGVVSHTLLLWVVGVGLMLVGALKMIGTGMPRASERRRGGGPQKPGGLWRG
jgi:uncharacterized membrane protein HdeD (DUF308 family)